MGYYFNQILLVLLVRGSANNRIYSSKFFENFYYQWNLNAGALVCETNTLTAAL